MVKKVAKKKPAPQKARPVVVTTAHRGVFFGYVAADHDDTTDTIRLTRARMAVYWTSDSRGVLGLAAMGPLEGSRIGPAVDLTLRGVTAVMAVTTEAVGRWESAPWR